jgi:prevent-host-death family protein
MSTELVATLKRRATEILSERKNEKAPVLITQYGKPAADLVEVETYDDLQRR